MICRHIDLVTEGRLVDIVAEGFDFGVRSASLVPSDMIVIPLGPPQRYAVVGTPAYFCLYYPNRRNPLPRSRHSSPWRAPIRPPSNDRSTAPWRQEIRPSVNAFRVAAARVEHSSLRNMLSMWVRTVLGLMSSSLATCLLLAPRLISRST